MPFETHWEEHGVYNRFWGEVTDTEIEAKNREFSADVRCGKSRYRIFDGTDIQSLNLSKHAITDFACIDIGMCFYLKNLSIVLVGTSHEVRKMHREYVSICQRVDVTWKFQICDTLEQGRAWLEQLEYYKTPTPSPIGHL